MKDAERAAEDPLIRLERENKKLQSEKLRLEMENEYLARELVSNSLMLSSSSLTLWQNKLECLFLANLFNLGQCYKISYGRKLRMILIS